MPKPTSLRILGERPVVVPHDDPDTPVSTAFTNENTTLSEDVLDLLRKSHENATTAVTASRTAINTATAAVERVNEVESRQTAVAAMAQSAKEVAISRQTAAITESVSILRHVVLALVSLLSFLADRAPAILALLGGWLLWRDTLSDPNTMKLIGLALYAAGVVAPATWLTARKGT